MAMQLFTWFKSRNERQFLVDIYNANHATSATEVICNNCYITYSGIDDDVLDPIKSSDLTLTIIKNAAVDTLITDMISGKEGDFTLRVRNQADNSLFWCGIIVIDEITVEDYSNSANAFFSIRAIDGIGRLKEITFDEVTDGITPNSNAFIEYVIAALAYNGLESFWGTNDVYIRESCEFYETQMPTPTATNSPFLWTSADKRIFGITNEANGKIYFTKGKNCYEVLQGILQIMCCRLIHVNGSYYIQQVRNFTNITYTERQIVKAGSVASSTSFAHRVSAGNTVAARLNGASWSYQPPLQYVSVMTTPKNFGISYDKEESRANIINANTPQTSSTIEDIQVNRNDTTDRLVIVIPAQITNTASDLSYRLRFRITITAGDWRVVNDGRDKMIWTLSPPDFYEYIVSDGSSDLEKYSSDDVFAFESEEIPFTSESIDVTVEVTMIDFQGSAPLSTDVGWWIGAPRITGNASLSNAYEEYRVDNPNTLNSIFKDYDKLELTDNPNELMGWNTFTVWDGTDWKPSNVWDADFTTDEPLVRTLALEHMSLQRRPIQLLNATLKHMSDLILPINSYWYNTSTYVFNGGTLNLITNELSGQWFKSILTRTSLTIEKYGDVKGDGWKNLGHGTGNGGNGDKKEERQTDDALGLISVGHTGSATTLTVDEVYTNKIKSGDTVHLYNGRTNHHLGFYVVSSTPTAGGTTISVTSKDIGVDVKRGDYVAFDYFEVMPSDLIRGGIVQTIDLPVGIPTTSAPDILIANGMIVIDGVGKLWYRSNDKIYSVAGLEST
jgi:hypothetical protein